MNLLDTIRAHLPHSHQIRAASCIVRIHLVPQLPSRLPRNALRRGCPAGCVCQGLPRPASSSWHSLFDVLLGSERAPSHTLPAPPHRPSSPENAWRPNHLAPNLAVVVRRETPSSPFLTSSDRPRATRNHGVAKSVHERPLNQEQLSRRHQRPRPLISLWDCRAVGALHRAGAAAQRLPEHGRKGECPESREHWW